MKTSILIFSILFLSVTTFSVEAAVELKKWETITFKVYGNCGMCKTTIEKALKDVEGVRFAIWSEKSKKITVKYNPKLITLESIHNKIASVGYDTDKVKAKDEVYNKLHGCCQYDRSEN
jgi:copper chaperone CopZ